MSFRLQLAAVLLAFGIAGCDGDGSGEPSTTSSSTGGGGDGGGSVTSHAGVPDDGCATGFEHDGDHGCVAVLPPEPCPAGQMAVPGEISCHPVAPCGTGTWGDIETEPNTQHVDQNHPGPVFDGTEANPWQTISEAVVAADADALVAIAEGTYVELVEVDGTPVRLWGRCPELVEIVNPSSEPFALLVIDAHGAEIHNLAVRSTRSAIITSATAPLLIEGVWVHDTGLIGIGVEETLGPTDVLIRNTLVESVTGYGIASTGSTVTLEAVVVRDVAALNDEARGRGLQIAHHPDTSTRSSVHVQGSLFERNDDANIAVVSSDLTIRATAVRDGQPFIDGVLGVGVLATEYTTFGASNLTIEGCTIERNRASGIVAQATQLTVTATTIRDTTARESDGLFGRGVLLQTRSATPAHLHMTDSLVERSQDVGVFGIDSSMELERVLVRSTTPDTFGRYGDGVTLMSSAALATATVTSCRIETASRAGLASFGADLVIGHNELRCNPIHLDGERHFDWDYSFTDRGGNTCGCDDELVECQVLTSNLEPPLAP